MYKSHTTGRQGAAKLRKLDFAERHGYIKGVVREIVHDSGRGAPLARIQFKDAYKFKRNTELVIACEGMHTGQFIYCGRKGTSVFYSHLWLRPTDYFPCLLFFADHQQP